MTTTAYSLLAALEPFRPTVEGGALTFAADPPPELDPVLKVLHVGVRALLTNRTWYGERSDRPGLTALNPSAPIPVGITLLSAEGDRRWDRIDPAARIDLPELFENP